ncbi:MAG: hypothetical protein WBV74_18275 [Pseudonocardiaceae bacterium]
MTNTLGLLLREEGFTLHPPLRIFPEELPVYADRNSLTNRIRWYHYELT